MRLKFFSVPFHDPDDVAGDVNQFLAGHRILAIERNLVQDGANRQYRVVDAGKIRCAHRAGSGGGVFG